MKNKKDNMEQETKAVTLMAYLKAMAKNEKLICKLRSKIQSIEASNIAISKKFKELAASEEK